MKGNQWITEHKAAEILGVKPDTMRKYRDYHPIGEAWRYRQPTGKAMDIKGRPIRRGIQWNTDYLQAMWVTSA